MSRGKAWSGMLGLWMVVGCTGIDVTGDDGAADTGSVDGDTSNGDSNGNGNDDGMNSADGDSSGGMGPAAEVPDNAYCAGVIDWTEPESLFEEEVVELVNVARAGGATCGSQVFGAAGPLSMQPALRCAARVHSLDMAVRQFFDHDNPDGEDPFVRMEQAGYQYSSAGENIAAGQTTPEEVVQGWLESPGHCSNIMDPGFVHIGVGYALTADAPYPHYWTQTFGSP